MKHTGFSTGEASDGDFAWPYKESEGAYTRQVLPRKADGGPAGGIVSTATDLSRWLLARLGLEVDGARALSDAALKQLHSPSMLGGAGIGLAEFGERQPMGYALGCQVEAYRGHRVIRHGGNLVGYSSDICVAPDLKAGVVVLTNLHGSGLRDALALMILDRLLGLEPVPWGERYHELMGAFRGGAVAATKHRLAEPEGRPAPRPLADYAGVYTHPAYGEFDVTVDGDKLATNFHGLADVVALRHRNGDVWDFQLIEFDSAMPLVFNTDLHGGVGSLSIGLEPTVDPIVFSRRVDAPPADVLERLVGRYEMGPISLEVERHDDTLRAALPMSGKVSLAPAGGLTFTVPGMSGLTVTFETDDAGAVTQVVVHPIGLFKPAG
jgi:hypothetical protein